MRLRRRGHLKQGSRAGARRPHVHVHVKRQGLDAEREPTVVRTTARQRERSIRTCTQHSGGAPSPEPMQTHTRPNPESRKDGGYQRRYRDNRDGLKQQAVPLRRRGETTRRFGPSFSG